MKLLSESMRTTSSSQTMFYYGVVDVVKVFGLAMLVEWLSNTRIVSNRVKNQVAAGIIQTLMYGVRMAMALLVMLAVMSFKLYIFVAAVSGFSFGFLIFGTTVFHELEKESNSCDKASDLPPLNC